MILKTDKGETIKTSGTKGHGVEGHEPHWSEFHKRFYVWGHRLIKTKGTFSTVNCLHNFQTFTPVEG